jgi:hypothetical protein
MGRSNLSLFWGLVQVNWHGSALYALLVQFLYALLV